MHSFSTVEAIFSYVNEQKAKGNKIGFVPTMGALHDGHLSLVKRALVDNDIVVCSIFVNPTQFNDKSDLENYPSDLNRDLQLLESANCSAVFFPSVSEMYPDNIQSDVSDIGAIGQTMEGAKRPGHFEGVITIVKKLFTAVPADNAYFGEKDYQQLAVIRHSTRENNIPVKIVGCPIIRESNGLAMSSRNQRLSLKAKEQASLIFNQLNWVKQHYSEMSVSELIQAVEMAFDEHDEFTLEYLTIADENTLQPFEDRRSSKNPRVFIAVWIEGIRLIDNLGLQE